MVSSERARLPRGLRRMGLWLSPLVLALAGLSGLGAPATTHAEGVSMARGDACDGLSREACCAQALDTYIFKATGDQPERRTRMVTELACNAKQKKALPQHVCRQLLVARGMAAADAQTECRPKGLATRCKKDKACRACQRQLGGLGYRSHVADACLGATWQPRAEEPFRVRL